MSEAAVELSGGQRRGADEQGVHSPLAELQRQAGLHGWRCLTRAWCGYAARYTFACPMGHRFGSEGMYILYNLSESLLCPVCILDMKHVWVDPE